MTRKVGKMKSNAKSIIIILITVGIFLALLPINTDNHSDDIAIDNEILKTSEVSGKISINGNSGWANAKTSDICTGFGTQSEPYVIEDLEIDGGDSGSCITIENSDVYFEIENCTVYNSESGFGGISLSNVYNGKLINNTLSFNQGNGITIKECENITIGNNTINCNSGGIWILNPLSPSANINILGNNMYNNTGFSIFLFRVDNSLISNNTITQTKFGMCINRVNELQVRNNILFNCTGEGIAPHSGNHINLTGNLMAYCGISGISDDYSELSTYSIDTSNKVNGKPVYYYLDRNNLNNVDYLNPGQIILVNCNSSNISEISISDTANALTLLYCSNVSVLDCNFSDNLGGINLDYSNNNTISRNVLDRNYLAGIYLSESSHNFISLNNISSNTDDGIYLSDCSNIEILENEINDNIGYGINIQTCENITIGNNTIQNNFYGIYESPLSGPPGTGTSVNINIVENKIYNNTMYGVFFSKTNNSYVSKNNVSLGYFGIGSFSSNDTLVRNNRVEDCSIAAIYVSSGNNLNLSENLMISCGILIFGEYSALSTHSIDTSNKVNGKPVYFHLDSNNLDNSDYINPGQIILVNCNSSNISDISISNTAYALSLLYCNNVSVLDCNFSDNFVGIRLYYSNDNAISRNIFSDNQGGLSLFYSNNNAISRNTIDSNNNKGIDLYESNHNSISLNNISNNYNDLSPTLPYQGVPPPPRDEIGIAFRYDSNNNTISGNTINNNKIGIFITKGANNTVKGNYVTENYEYGVFLETYYDGLATLNLVYCNSFKSNGINAQDNGTVNLWDDGFIGNYWDNYSGKDANDDGIGDTPYSVPGSAGSQDNFPIWDDGDDIPPNIIINSPSADEIFGNNAPGYNLTVIEPNIHTRWYTLDSGTTNITFTGLTGTISQTIWDSISEGDVTIRFYVNDSAGNINFEEIKVLKQISEDDGIPGYNLFFLLGTISVVTIVISTKLKKFNK